MDNSLYILLSKEIGLFREMNTIADNLANSETTGFKSKNSLFKEFQIKEQPNKKISFTNDIATWLDIKDGPIKITNNFLDFAIIGKGFFKILSPLGEVYTRAGSFSINNNGILVTALGYPVLNTNGSIIEFEPGLQDLKVNRKGMISANGVEMEQLGITIFENAGLLAPIGGSLYALGQAIIVNDSTEYQIFQGALETSNVNKIREMTNSIENQRTVGALVNMTKSVNSLEKSLVRNLLKTE